MIVKEINAGPKIAYEVDGTRVCFDDDLSINLAKREEDCAVHIDICYDSDGALVVGHEVAREYVAQIDIPPRRYVVTPVEDDDSDDGDVGLHTEPVD